MPALTVDRAAELDRQARTVGLGELAAYLQANLGQRMTAYLAGLRDPKQVGRWQRPEAPQPSDQVMMRLREAYKIVQMLVEAYDAETAKAWLFGTNTRLDDRAPIELIREAETPGQFTPIIRAARQAAAFQV
jgi:hypothetical protein